ncbi:MAG TPA: glycosyltransferase family 4 protein [Opitutaceae bacterium]|jgi:glycosyltransferase involved in cell wall biosynthesis|nr:glycosyltransferase family 4 protein [Opitutaceae bacterium]
MKVLFVHERFGALGGAESNILATAGALARCGHKTGLLHGSGTEKQEDAWREAFRPCFPYGETNSVAGLESALTEFKPDVIFLHKMADIAMVEALVDCAVPVVRMVHDHDLTCMRSYRYNPLSRRICTRAASPWCVFPCGACVTRNAGPGPPLKWVSYTAKRRELALNRKFARLVVATHYMKTELLRNGFAADRIAIHAPVPRPADGAFQSSFGKRNLIVYSGQIIRGKGVDVLLESLALLTTPFEAVILGDGGHRAHCEHLSRRLGLRDRVHFTGFIPQPEITRHYRESSVAVISSIWPEPFGAVGLEAMRCGLPVVGFDAGGIKEWLIDGVNGYLVPWMDRAQYARRIGELLQDKTLARTLGEHGRQLASERFSFAHYIRGLETLFTGITATRPCLTT